MASEKKLDSVILGLLSHQNLTGYEIKKRMDTTLKYFWGASYGSIYPTLNSLVSDGLATKLNTTENGRNKIIYTITENGRNHLKQWLSSPVEKDEIRYETLLKLFFGSDIGEKTTLGHIKNFELKIQNDLPFLVEAVDTLEKIQDIADAHKYYLLTAKFGVKVFQAYLEWCAESETILQGSEEK